MGSDTKYPMGAVIVEFSLKMDAAEIAKMPSENAKAVFAGIAQAMAAQHRESDDGQ